MARAKRPVSVAGIEFDALISSDYGMEATVPEYAVESGFHVSDAIILKSETLSMVLYVTDNPVTWYDRHNKGRNRVSSVTAMLESLYYSKQPVTVITSEKTYTNMAIESIKISKSLETGYAREIPISFRKIRTTSTQTTIIPAEYGKSGATGSGSGSSSNSASNGSNGSILYNAGKTTGIL